VKPTSDVVDEYGERAAVCTAPLRQFGRRRSFTGQVSTVRCHEDNVLLRQRLAEPGFGGVLVVDGGGSDRVALLGEMVAGLAYSSGWSGLVIHGCVRDTAALHELELGIKALGPCPRASGKTGAGELDVPVTFGGVTFRSGAMLWSDDDGLVVVDSVTDNQIG
jgi:regulator of ribonuclease activity A